MIYVRDTYDKLVDRIKKQDKKIIVYGAGMIGNVVVPYLIRKYELYDKVLFFVDKDSRKHGSTITVDGYVYVIATISELLKNMGNAVIWITNSNFSDVVDYLDQIEDLNESEAWIIPILQKDMTNVVKEKAVSLNDGVTIIPKIINYCWFSGKAIPTYLQKCIDSWKKYCPDYEIIRWDENNYDIGKWIYTKQAYEQKKWGFVPDIARLEILYEQGGIYLDTDVELIKSLDDLLRQKGFVGVEKWGSVNFGGCSGSVKGNKTIKQILDYRKNEVFVYEDGSLNLTTCGFYETVPLMNMGFRPDNTTQVIGDLTVYSSDYFHPFDYMSGEKYITNNTHSIHYFSGEWLDESRRKERAETCKKYKRIIERMEPIYGKSL